MSPIKRQKNGDIILHIKTLSNEIKKTLLAEEVYTSLPSLTTPKTEKKVFQAPQPDNQLLLETSAGKNQYTVIESEDKASSFSYWESHRFNANIIGIGIGDLDGDKRNDTVVAEKDKVAILNYLDGRFQETAKIKNSIQEEIITVDVADINNNGKSEIFITCINKEMGQIKSIVLEWDGRKFNKIAENHNWYFRVINLQDRGKVLIGQKKGMSDIFVSGIYEFQWYNGHYARGKRLELPRRINVYGFTMGDVLNNKQEMIVAFDGNDYIQLFNQDGKKEAISKKRYGGSTIYLESVSVARFPDGADDEMERFYIPQRLHLADLDMDGKNEIVLVKNETDFGRLFEKIRSFKTGYIECLSWDNLGIQSEWKTREVLGYISDFAIADFDSDGNDEIVVSVVNPKSLFDGKEISNIVSFEIGKLRKKNRNTQHSISGGN